MTSDEIKETTSDLADQNSGIIMIPGSNSGSFKSLSQPDSSNYHSCRLMPGYSLVGSRCPIDSEIQDCHCYKTICRKHASNSTISLSSLESESNLLKNGKSQKKSSTSSNHCHDVDIETESGVDKEARKKLIIASILCFFFMVGEIIGGSIANSLAVMTDAAHLLADFASFMISLLAIYLAARPPSKQMSFGWYRAEVIGAFVSVLLIWLVTGILVYMAAMRIKNGDAEIGGKAMLVTSVLGVFINIVMAFTLHQYGHGHSHGGSSHAHSHHGTSSNQTKSEDDEEKGEDSDHFDAHAIGARKENINVRAAFIHVIGDLLQSIGVMIAAIIIFVHPHLKIADPICTFIFSILVLITTINILRDALQVLMEGTPRGLDFNEVKTSLYEIPGVVELHNLRMWSLTTSKTAVSVHLALSDQKDSARVLRVANNLLRKRFFVKEVTIQLEQFLPEMTDCKKCLEN